MSQANFQYSDSSIFSSTLQPSSFKAFTKAWTSGLAVLASFISFPSRINGGRPDRAIESGGTTALEALLIKNLRVGLRDAFARVQAKKSYDVNGVAAGREYVKAYVEYIHFVERLHEATTAPAPGHFAEAESR